MINLVPQKQSKERRFRIDFTLTPSQQEIENCAKRFTFVRAGRKAGKTKYSEWKALKWLSPPNAVHWHIAPTYKQARLISWDAYKRLIPSDALYKKPNDSDLSLQLKNGAQLFLMGSDEENSLRGPAPTSVTFEEAAYHKAGVWSKIIRPALTVHRAPALFISSPNGFNWFKDLEDEALDDPEWAVFHKTIYDNPYISPDEIESIKKKCDPRVWRQEYMAEYESSIGRVFHEFQDTPRHVYSFVLPVRTENCFRSIDWGMRDDCGMLWSVIRGNKLFIYRENADSDLPPNAQAQIMRNRTPDNEYISRNIIGHDAAKQDVQMRGLTVQWHFSNAGIVPLRLSSRNKDASRAFLGQLISEDRLVIHPECRKLRRQLLAYEWKDTVDEKPMKPEDGNDDLVDSLHYMVELLQYDLFLQDRTEHKRTLEETYRLIRAEKMAQQRHSLTVSEPSFVPSFNDSAAGYL